jgi:hypothetical protein
MLTKDFKPWDNWHGLCICVIQRVNGHNIIFLFLWTGMVVGGRGTAFSHSTVSRVYHEWWDHVEGKWYGYIEATSQDISLKLKLGSSKWTMTPSILPKLWQNGLRTTNSRYWSSHHKDLSPIDKLWAELKKCVRARRPTNLTQLHQLCPEEWAKIHPTYCGKLLEVYLKHLTQVKQFKGKATKYSLSVYVNFWSTGNLMKKNKSWNKSFFLLLFWHFTFLK